MESPECYATAGAESIVTKESTSPEKLDDNTQNNFTVNRSTESQSASGNEVNSTDDQV